MRGLSLFDLAFLAPKAGGPGDLWADRVEANGGARPSEATIAAANTFMGALDAAGITSKFKALNIYAPDNLTAARTPLIVGVGSDPWTNYNFVSGDLTTEGLIGNGSNKKLDTGINARTHMSDTSAGLTIYLTSTGNDGANIGLKGTNGSDTFMQIQYAGVSYFDCVGQGSARISASNSNWLGYLSGNRTASNAIALYKASPTVAHTSIASSAGATQYLYGNSNIFVHALGDGGSGEQFSSRRLAFAAIHEGLSSSESSALYNAVQTLRESLLLYGLNFDWFEEYTDGAELCDLNGGTGWAGAWVCRPNALGVQADDQFEGYTDGQDVNGLDGGNDWTGAWVAR